MSLLRAHFHQSEMAVRMFTMMHHNKFLIFMSDNDTFTFILLCFSMHIIIHYVATMLHQLIALSLIVSRHLAHELAFVSVRTEYSCQRAASVRQ